MPYNAYGYGGAFTAPADVDWQRIKFALRVTALNAAQLPKTDLFGKIDAFIVLSIGSFREETAVVHKDYNPEWNHTFQQLSITANERFALELWDWNKRSNELVETFQLSVWQLYDEFHQALPESMQDTAFETAIQLKTSKKPSCLRCRFYIEWPQELRALSAASKAALRVN
jgi:hypothetical protein